MLDIRLIKENPEEIKARLEAKGRDCTEEIDRILELDAKRRDLIHDGEQLKARQNKASKEIPARKKAGEDVAPLLAEMKAISDEIKASDAALKDVDAEWRTLMLALPNLPDPDLKPGGKENNEPLCYYGEPHKFDFEPKNHVDLCTSGWNGRC